jgi:hypothetical protein
MDHRRPRPRSRSAASSPPSSARAWWPRISLPPGRVGWRYAVLAMRSESITIAYSSTVALEVPVLSLVLDEHDAFEMGAHSS